MTTTAVRARVPPRALVFSLAAMAVPVSGTFLLPGWAEDQGVLIWLTSVVPAFLLAYYRGLMGVAVALAGGMAVLVLTQVVVLLLGVASPNWAILGSVVAAYLGISIGIGVFAEILHRERSAAEQMAFVDQLTGLPNRRHAELALNREFAAATRGRLLAVVIFDLDHFKQVNDQNGHKAGDEALRAFTNVLKRSTRRMNLSARFGGEEFISILADCDGKAAVEFANRVREGIKAVEFPWGQVTVSVGAASYQEGMGSYEVLVAAADRALYAAKDAGRNRVEVAPELEPVRPVTRQAESLPVSTSGGQGMAERVLVVDDDADVCGFLARALTTAGYHAEESNDPEDVIRRYSDGAVDFDLLIADVMMPKMNGLTLVDRLSSFVPNLRVVYMSGYMHGQVSWAGLPGSVVTFLEKPIRLAQLLQTVRGALDEQPTPLVQRIARSAPGRSERGTP